LDGPPGRLRRVEGHPRALARAPVEQLGSGIAWSVEWVDRGIGVRTRTFFLRAVKAQRTVSIRIEEPTGLTAPDLEFDAVVESLHIRPQSR
jgi:hypothetical protein